MDHDGAGNYVTQITFEGSGGTVSLSGEEVRSILSLYSGSFDVMVGTSLSAYQSFGTRLIEGA